MNDNNIIDFKLPFLYNSLEPSISSLTIYYHYEKHHIGYINNVKVSITNNELTLENIIKNSNGSLYNNSTQIWNHNFYWNSLSSIDTQLSFDLENSINYSFGSIDNFKNEFIKCGISFFGSGWIWLVKYNNDIKIMCTNNSDNFILNTKIKPLFVCDLWEHAYYLDYKNNKKEYISNFFKKINWNFASKNFL